MEENWRYEEKLQILGTCDPYSTPADLFKPLKVVTFVEKLQFSDISVYLVELILLMLTFHCCQDKSFQSEYIYSVE